MEARGLVDMSHRFADPCTGFPYRICSQSKAGTKRHAGQPSSPDVSFSTTGEKMADHFSMIDGTKSAKNAHSSQRNMSKVGDGIISQASCKVAEFVAR